MHRLAGAHVRTPIRSICFVDAVANGKRNMPAWDDVLNPEQMEALWAYVITGEAGN